MKDKNLIKEKIIRAAFICIEKFGYPSLTIRKIAEESGLNVSAVNYYFESKEKLVAAVEKFSIKSAFTDWDEVTAGGRDAKEKIELFLLHWIGGMFSYPNFSKAYIYEPLMNNNYKGIYIKQLNRLLSEIELKLKAEGLQTGTKELKFILMHLFSVTIFTGMLPHLFEEYAGQDFRDISVIREYIQFITNKAFSGQIINDHDK